MPDEQSHAQGSACVAGGRLDPQVGVRTLAQDAAVGHAVQRHAASQAQPRQTGLFVDMTGHAEQNLLGHGLDRRRQIHLALGQRRLRPPRRAAEQPLELPRRHGQPLAVIEVGHVHAERAVRLQIDQLVPDQVGVLGLAVGGQSHQLVFARIDAKATEIREGRIEQTGRVREVQFVGECNPVAAAVPVAGRGPLAHAIHGQDRRLVERRWEERAGRMRFVVLRKDVLFAVSVLQTLVQFAPQVQLLLQPDRDRAQERPEPGRGKGKVRFQEPLEFQERLVVEAHVVQLLRPDARFPQAVFDRVHRKPLVVFLASKAFLLRGGDDLPIADQRGCRIVIESRDAKDDCH